MQSSIRVPRHREYSRRLSKRRQGTSIVEFALVAPILLAMVLGIIDFGMMARSTLIISNAAREGARAASLGQTQVNVISRIKSVATPPLKTDASGNISNGSIILEQSSPPTLGTVASALSFTAWPGDVTSSLGTQNGVSVGNYVRVTITYNYHSITGLFTRTVSIPMIIRREN